LTLVELAQCSGVDKSTISYLERGLRSGTVELVGKLCRGLGVTLAEFYAGLDGWQGPVEVQQAEARVASYVVPERGLTLQHLTTHLLGKPFGPSLLFLAPSGSTGEEELRPGTVKFCYVLDGCLEICVNSAHHRLKAGDTIFFDAAQRHTVVNVGELPAQALVVVSPPTV